METQPHMRININMIKKNTWILLTIAVVIFFLALNFSNLYKIIFNFYCTTGNESLLSVNTHNLENMSSLYGLLYRNGNKNKDILEQFFSDSTQTSLDYRGIPLAKGDVAWFLYSDLFFDDVFIESVYMEFNIPYGQAVFYLTISDNEMRKAIFEYYKKHITLK